MTARRNDGTTERRGDRTTARGSIIAILILVALCTPAAAQRSLAIPRFDARIEVLRDGSIDVTERIQAEFTGSWNGIYRMVPVKYRTPQGFSWSIQLDLVSATDDRGTRLRTETSRVGHYLKYKIWVPGAVNATRTVVLRYRAKNALRFFDDHDELYWNATGDEWDVALGMVSAEVILPRGATQVRAAAFNGTYGATLREAEVAAQGPGVAFRMPRPLAFREGMTVVVGWDKGLVRAPTAADRAAGFLASNWPLGIPFLVLAGMLRAWWRRGRDPRALPIVVQYEPPLGITPAEAGTLTDEKVDLRDITATMVDLAVRGFLRIEEREEKHLFGLLTNEEFVFHRLKPETEWVNLAPHEQGVLGGIFEDKRDQVKLSDLKDEFYTHLPGIQEGVMDRLVGKSLFRSNPSTTRSNWVFAGVLLGVVLAVGGNFLAGRFSLTPVPFFVAAFASALIVVAIGWFMPARTVSGARTLERVLGFGEFLERVDKERFEAIERTPELFERYLPFAMAFGVEQKWAKGFKDLLTQPPTWYSGANVASFNAGSFTRNLSAMSERAASTMSSSPRTSSGSGFGGGGSSGGGGGGGGGGGF